MTNNYNFYSDKDYEEARKNGLLLILPYDPAVIKKLYYVDENDNEIYCLKAEKIEICKTMIFNRTVFTIDSFDFFYEDFGKKVFFNKELAELKLSEIINNATRDTNKISTGWIPCNERLPNEEYEQELLLKGKDAAYPVLVTAKNKTGHLSISKAWFLELFLERNFYDLELQPLDTIAWMPLPEPYKGE